MDTSTEGRDEEERRVVVVSIPDQMSDLSETFHESRNRDSEGQRSRGDID